MKSATLSTFVLLALFSVACSQETANAPPIASAELNRRHVIGALGVPLGTATEIQAQVIAGRELRLKAYDSLYLLKVTQLDGIKLDDPAILTFSIPPFTRAQLARNAFDLYALKTGKTATSLDSSQIEKLEEEYIGTTVRLVVYEVGSFAGIPKNLPKDVPTWTDHDFHFYTSLIVLAERE